MEVSSGIPSGHEHTQCEGEGDVCRGFYGLEGKRLEDDGFSQPMPTTLEDLGQSVLCQHHRCASERKRTRTLVLFQETVALQTPRQQPRMEHSEWVSGVEAESLRAQDGSIQQRGGTQHKMLTSGPHGESELIGTFTATLERRNSLRTTKKAIRSTGPVHGMQTACKRIRVRRCRKNQDP